MSPRENIPLQEGTRDWGLLAKITGKVSPRSQKTIKNSRVPPSRLVFFKNQILIIHKWATTFFEGLGLPGYRRVLDDTPTKGGIKLQKCLGTSQIAAFQCGTRSSVLHQITSTSANSIQQSFLCLFEKGMTISYPVILRILGF